MKANRIKAVETHAEKMVRKRQDRATRVGFSERSPSVKSDLAKFGEYWRGVRRKNGIGSRTIREARAGHL